jgi:hypothetical protein
VSTHCPSQADLLLAALGTPETREDERVRRHEVECAPCRRELARLRQVVSVLRSGVEDMPTLDACLDEADLARLAEGLNADRDRSEIRHLIRCAPCRAELGAAVALLHDPAVVAELQRLTAPAPRWWQRPATAGLAAAAIAGLVLWPVVTQTPVADRGTEIDALRERTITTTAAPRIVAPVAAVASADSLRWTSVPRADLYRVTFWRADGTVVWQSDIRDTVHALPPEITASGEESLLWEVQARTGWDRWVVSDIAELTLTTPGVR